MWISLDCEQHVPEIMACLERYEASDEWARGVYHKPANWLHMNFRSNWTARPAPRKKTKDELTWEQVEQASETFRQKP